MDTKTTPQLHKLFRRLAVSQMQRLEQFFNPVPENEGDERKRYGDAYQDVKSSVLLIPDEVASKCQKSGSEEPANGTHDQELEGGHMPQPQHEAEVVFWKAGKEEQEKDEQDPLWWIK